MPREPADVRQRHGASADPAKIAGSKIDFMSRGQVIAAFIAGAYHYISGKRQRDACVRVCTAHARRSRVCIAFEGNVVLGTVGHGHPRGALERRAQPSGSAHKKI